jgi:hypothetical protein
MKRECIQLDSYLAGDLSAQQAQLFELHVLECDVCREELRQQQWIDELLQSPVRLQLEPVPPKLTCATQLPSSKRQRRLLLAACGIAASLLIAAGLIALVTTDGAKPIASNSNRPKPITPTIESSAPDPPPATFVSDENTITVPLTSTASDVTVVQVYPTLETERRWHRTLVLQNTLTKSNGG